MARFCEKCGAEVPNDGVFCPKCGSSLPTPATGGVVYRKEREVGWGPGRVISLVFGGFMLFVAMGLIFGGGAVLWSQTALTDNAGYMTTKPLHLTTATYAVIEDGIDVQMHMSGVMQPEMKDIVSFKLTATSTDGSPIFIGIAQSQSADTYLDGVNVDRLVNYSWEPDGSDVSTPEYQTISGGAPSSPPTAQSFWVAQASGSGTQTITWTPTSGEYTVVIMNGDGSKAVDVNAQVGVRVTILSWVGYGLLIAGAVVAAIGIASFYFGVFRRH